MNEIYPNITWEKESTKVMTGSEFQKGEAGAIRSSKASLDLLKKEIQAGANPIERIDKEIDWLAKCLYSCNMENFK